MTKRYTIDVIGSSEADVTELFPDPTDPEDPSIHDLLGALSKVRPWEGVLDAWAYGDDFVMRITDTQTGAEIEFDNLSRQWVVTETAKR